MNLVCFQETKMDVMDQYALMQCLGPSFDGFAYVPVVDTCGGILLEWDVSVLKVENIMLNTNFLTGRVHAKMGEPWWITVVYER